ncbi:riboflavin synthase subunit alpha [Idiomarina aminovorans]|uniref:riboflavin synthase subunit alpha n=1 Tax=Idiomarina aminovorans TaxID=2914829 RepID=UPI00200466C2|nr:riboflavin synthase subunit alpha [Idiomarina sp. ATCH4]MCK7458426.1 riboflavin synthase subunit alpha [Idiomarina sp. ATCH4]
MFTGIVQTQATIFSVSDQGSFRHLVIKTEPQFLQNLAIGASVAINGCCLTAVEVSDTQVHFDVIDETLRLTNLGLLGEGDKINLERSLKVGDEIGGHAVSGHIHCQGKVTKIDESENNVAMWIDVPEQYLAYLFAKGFIAINGASLTIGQVQSNSFSLHLIPETQRLTNLELTQVGDNLNIEFDQQTITIVETVERVLAKRQ